MCEYDPTCGCEEEDDDESDNEFDDTQHGGRSSSVTITGEELERLR